MHNSNADSETKLPSTECNYPFIYTYLERFYKPGHRVLDVGCGNGKYRSQFKDGYFGIDIQMQRHTKSMHGPDCLSDAQYLSFSDSSFDLIFTVATLYQVKLPVLALNEFHRVLRPGGRILIFDYNRRTQQQLENFENAIRPCWRQNDLKKLVCNAGFTKCELLPKSTFRYPYIIRQLFLLYQEWHGSWAIVTGKKL